MLGYWLTTTLFFMPGLFDPQLTIDRGIMDGGWRANAPKAVFHVNPAVPIVTIPSAKEFSITRTNNFICAKVVRAITGKKGQSIRYLPLPAVVVWAEKGLAETNKNGEFFVAWPEGTEIVFVCDGWVKVVGNKLKNNKTYILPPMPPFQPPF